MKYTYTKQYPATNNDIFKDTNWAYDQFGPRITLNNSVGRWSSHIHHFENGQWTLSFSFNDSDDYALFVLVCG